jgi:hypothetical protein
MKNVPRFIVMFVNNIACTDCTLFQRRTTQTYFRQPPATCLARQFQRKVLTRVSQQKLLPRGELFILQVTLPIFEGG